MSVVLVTSHVVMKRQVRCHGRVAYPAVCLVYSSVGLLWFYMVYLWQRAATVMGPVTHTIEIVFFRMLRALLADVAGSTKRRQSHRG